MGKAHRDDVNDEELAESDLYYNVEDKPPIVETLFFGFQLAVANICYTIMFVVMLQSLICADQDFSSKMFSTVSFMVGVTTILQTYVGVRMPIFQGPTPLFFLPYMTAATDPRWRCNAGIVSGNETLFVDMSSIASNVTRGDEGVPPWAEEWAKASGSLMMAQVVQMILALTGTVALVMRIVRPIAIAVIFILLGIWLHGAVADFVKVHWGIAALSATIILILSQYLNWVQVPLPAWKRDVGFYWTRLPLFELFPVLIGIAIVWAISAIITMAGGFTDDHTDIGYNARTDIYGDSIRNAPVFTFAYPGQFSWIDFSLEYFLINLVAVMMTTMESMGDYCQYAVTCYMPRPPDHAFNRGIFMEGLCGFFSALIGMGHTTTSYSHVIGLIKISKVASRRVFATAGAMLMILGVFGKAGAIFVSIPKSVLAGPVYVGISLLVGVAVMNLKQVDLSKTRNQTTIGCSIMLGVFLPFYFQAHPGDIDTVLAMLRQSLSKPHLHLDRVGIDRFLNSLTINVKKTAGSPIVNRIIISFLTVPFLVGGIMAIFLDNTLPGRKSTEVPIDKDDGNEESLAEGVPESKANGSIVLELDHMKTGVIRRKEDLLRQFDPPFITKYTRRWRWTRFVPILPKPYKSGEEDVEEKIESNTRG